MKCKLDTNRQERKNSHLPSKETLHVPCGANPVIEEWRARVDGARSRWSVMSE